MKFFCGEIIRFGNFRRELISIFAGRHLPRNFFVDTYFPLVFFAGSILPFLRGDTLRGDFFYFCGESIFVKFWQGVAFRFRGETPCTMNFFGENFPLLIFAESIFPFSRGDSLRGDYYFFFAGNQFPFLQMDLYTFGYNKNGVVHTFLQVEPCTLVWHW
jgi:hypothetical protein